MARFFIDPGQINNGKLTITGPDVKHIQKVLRLSAGDEITVLDGTGWAYRAQLLAIGSKEVQAEVIEHIPWPTEPLLSITLVQGIAKGEKMELILQKCTELGVNAFMPVVTDRTVVDLAAEKKGKRRERWQRVAEEAAKQAGRARIPVVGDVCRFSEVWDKIPSPALKIIPYEGEKANTLREALAMGTAKAEVYVFIGPEGGFTDEEIHLAAANGALPVTLGPRILRTETAGMATCAVIMHVLGDLG